VTDTNFYAYAESFQFKKRMRGDTGKIPRIVKRMKYFSTKPVNLLYL
jgi:hypothetical protein